MIKEENDTIRLKCVKCGRFLLKVIGEMDGIFIECPIRQGCGTINFYSIKRGRIIFTYLEPPMVEPEYSMTKDEYINLINLCNEQRL